MNATPQTDGNEADADTVASRAAQVIATMGADIRALTGERDRYRAAWRSARERAQAYGEGILRVVKDREQYQEWLRQAEARTAPAVVSSPPATDRATVLREAEARLCARAAELVAAADADPLADVKRGTDARRHSAECWIAAADELRRLADEAQQQCPGYETVPNRCACPCEGCMHHCGAHQPAVGARQPDTKTQDGPLRAELKPWQLLGAEEDGPVPQTERLTGGRRLTETQGCPDPIECSHEAALGQAQAAIAELAQAIRLTREYVGEELLPPVEGWSWYDALRRHAPHELASATAAPAGGAGGVPDETPTGLPVDDFARMLAGAAVLSGREDAAPFDQLDATGQKHWREQARQALQRATGTADVPHTMLGAAEIETRPDLNVTPLTGDTLNADEEVEK